jgi:isopentenyl-diphosphate Delta-isomerase
VNDQVILVDRLGNEIGLADKLKAHQLGLLHLAYSVMIVRVNELGVTEYLLQRRAFSKYHSGGLWSNTCCSHPKAGEDIKLAAVRRLNEELGIQLSGDIQQTGKFIYQAKLDNNLIEHELDHVYVAYESVCFSLNELEVVDCQWWSVSEVRSKLDEDPSQFTAWFPKVFSMVETARPLELSASLVAHQ